LTTPLVANRCATPHSAVMAEAVYNTTWLTIGVPFHRVAAASWSLTGVSFQNDGAQRVADQPWRFTRPRAQSIVQSNHLESTYRDCAMGCLTVGFGRVAKRSSANRL